MPASSDRRLPGFGRSLRRFSETEPSAGGMRTIDSLPAWPGDRPFGERTEHSRSGSPPNSSPYDMKTRHTPKSLSSGRRSSRWGFFPLRPIPHIPDPPRFTSRSRRGKWSLSFSTEDGLPEPNPYMVPPPVARGCSRQMVGRCVHISGLFVEACASGPR